MNYNKRILQKECTREFVKKHKKLPENMIECITNALNYIKRSDITSHIIKRLVEEVQAVFVCELVENEVREVFVSEIGENDTCIIMNLFRQHLGMAHVVLFQNKLDKNDNMMDI